MPNYLDLPRELEDLIEKREQEDRRIAQRRRDGEADPGGESLTERREGDRRSEGSRREDDA